MKEQRITKLADYISRKREVTMKELQAYFRVSMNTVRSDVAALEDMGIIDKVYGGVVYKGEDFTRPIAERLNTDTDAKRRIAKAAADLIQDGDIIYLDYGTTVKHMTEFLSDKNNVTVITPNVYVITSVVNLRNLRLIVLPGEFEPRSFGIVSENAVSDLRDYGCSKAFMACTGISKDGMVSSTTHFQREIKNTALDISVNHYLLVDHNKFNDTGLLHYGRLEDFDKVITDDGVAESSLSMMRQRKIDFVLA